MKQFPSTSAAPHPRHASARSLVPAVLLACILAACQPATPAPPDPIPSTTRPTPQAGQRHTPGHVFVINLENKGYDAVWGDGSAAPYLAGDLRRQGVLLTDYYAVAHHSLPNYLAQISGQPSNPSTRADCHTYTAFTASSTDSLGRLDGDGCAYPANVPTVAGQLQAAGKTWKGYMEDMDTSCEHPALGADDPHVKATADDMYATKHDPFVYFRSITDTSACKQDVVNYSALARDLKSTKTTPNLAYITPNLCHDGHDNPCADGSTGGLPAADQWLRQAVPPILASPAFKQDGMLVITFDESDGDTTGPADGTAGSVPGGTAGGKVGALVITPFSTPGASSAQPYNHYSLLASIEDYYSLPRLGAAREPDLPVFGPDVYQGSQG